MKTFEYIQTYEDGKYNVKVEVDQSADYSLVRASHVSIRVYFESFVPYKVYPQRTGFGLTVDGDYIQCPLNGSAIQNTYILAAQALRLYVEHDYDGNKSLPVGFAIPVRAVDPVTGEETDDLYLDFYHVFELDETFEALKIDGLIGDAGERQEIDVHIPYGVGPTKYDVKVIVGDYIYEGTSLYSTEHWTIPDFVIAEYPDSDSIPITCELDSWSLDPYGHGNDLYLGKDTKTFLCKIADSKKPTISVSVTDAMGHAGNTNDPFLNNKSNLQVTITASPNAGAQLASYSVVVGSNGLFRSSMGSSPITIDTGTLILASAGTSSIFVTTSVTDSRGMTTENVQEFSTADYWAPYIDDIHIIRCDIFGNEDIKGDNFKLEWSGEHVYTGRTLSKTLRYRATGDPWITVSNPVSGTIYYSIATVSPIEIEFTIDDGETSIVYKKQLSSASIIRHIRHTGKGVAFGGVCTGDEFQVHMPARFTSSVKGFLDNLDSGAGGSIDDLIEPGFYYLTTGGYSDLPDSINGWMMVMQGGSGSYIFRLQEFTTVMGSRFFRVAYNNNWSSWEKVSTTSV